MKKNKLIALLLTATVAVTSVVGGTLAYLTDRDSEANVFTVGNVDITLDENFGPETELLPGADINKDVAIKNEGPNEAWVWYTYAVPQGLEQGLDLEFENTDEVWTNEATAIGTKEVDGVIYNVYVCKYNAKLPAGETTPIGLSKVTMNPAVDITPEGDAYLVVEGVPTDLEWNVIETENPVIFVNAYAIQTNEFETFDEAYNAFAGQWGNMVDAGAYEGPSAADTWDGTADFALFSLDGGETLDDSKDEYVITTAEELAAFAEMVDKGNTFAGKTVKLGQNIDLYYLPEGATEPKSFDPIGYGYDIVFKGTFDGQDHTISNLYQNGWALGYDYSTEGGGLFASVVDATIKNLTIDNAEIVMECIDMGVVVGYSYGNCTYENITVSNSTIANYQRYTGGVVGEVNGTQTFKNVDVMDTVISSLWGDFDCSLGGIIGGKYGEATITMEDCDVACELNAYNDVTSSYQWYAYRRAGMLIGNSEETVTDADNKTSASASYLTCKNCTVTYEDWANYTYCEFAGTNWPYVRVQAGYSCDAYSNPRYGVATDANGNKAVDDTHVHNEGEDHNILLTFDQLYGGGQGVYGTATHDGVTVIYNNK